MIVNTLLDKGIQAAKSGELSLALDCFNQAISLEPSSAILLNNRANVLLALGLIDQALADYEIALRIDPLYINARRNRALTYMEHGHYEQAVRDWTELVASPSDAGMSYLKRGICLHEMKQYEASIADLERAAAYQPENLCELYAMCADSWELLEDVPQAIANYKTAVELNPSYSVAHFNLGLLYDRMNLCDLALTHFRFAVAADASQTDALYALAMAMLKNGDYANGWRVTQSRWKLPFLLKVRGRTDDLQWQEHGNVSNRTVLVCADQGLGDTLQFCRYSPLVRDKGAHVILIVPSALVSLLAHSFPAIQVISEGSDLPAFDYQCSVMNLPLVCGTESIEKIPAQMPYLYSDSAKRQVWRERLDRHLGGKSKRRVGLVWSGGYRPDQPEVWSLNERRNIPLIKLAGLKHPNIDFISLQKGEQAEQELVDLQAQGWDGPIVTSYSERLQDFSDTAALIDNLDLVIAVDTSTIHLAGAMGKPVWILNRFDACWRWLYGQDSSRSDSPWYPTARLFRQPKDGDWESVVSEVRQALFEMV